MERSTCIRLKISKLRDVMGRIFYCSRNLVPPLGAVSSRVVLAVLIASYLLAVTAAPAAAADDKPKQQLDCISCHPRTLTYHDKLGSGNQACWVCHDSTDMKSLRLVNGTVLAQSESSQVCGQCHGKRYDAWQEGTHGVPGTIATGKCSDCHDPHQPQMALLGITLPHPGPIPGAPDPSKDLAIIVIITLVSLTGLGIVVGRRGEGS